MFAALVVVRCLVLWVDAVAGVTVGINRLGYFRWVGF
jgi:hypothetical protein